MIVSSQKPTDMMNCSTADMMKCCPIDNTFKIIGKKFTIHIIRNMSMMGQTRFNQLLDNIEDSNPKTLSARLKEMEKADLISRKVYDETPIRIEYTLTKKGKDLEGIIGQMAAFSMKHYPKDIFKDGKSRSLKQVFKKPITLLN
jgi:DNA-binding HxlR family transcriptional regulator